MVCKVEMMKNRVIKRLYGLAIINMSDIEVIKSIKSL